jgi:hypothetical protein
MSEVNELALKVFETVKTDEIEALQALEKMSEFMNSRLGLKTKIEVTAK